MKEKKDVLFLCQYFYPEYVSSATLPYDTAKALSKAGFTVGAICGYPREYNKSGKVPLIENHENILIRRLKYLQLKRSNFIGRLINYFSFTFAVLLRFISLKNYKAIIVYSNPPVLPIIASWASKIYGSKMIFVSYDVYPEMAHITGSIKEDGLISKMMRFINKKIYKNVDKVVALSNEMKAYLLKHREQLRDGDVEVIPNWYEDKTNIEFLDFNNDLFKDINLKESLVVSYFGNMGICQDLDTILSAIKYFNNDDKIKFLFAGHGNKMEILKKSTKEKNLENVFIYDFLHGEDFQDALKISDCFLVSLAKGLTGLAVPSKTYSYMMARKPVIAIMGMDSDISKDLIENNAGYAMEVGEVDKLINSINELKNNKDLKYEMGFNSNKIFKEKYTTEKATQKYVDMMREILEEE